METFGVPGQRLIKATTLGSPPTKTGAASAPWSYRSRGQGPIHYIRLCRPPALEGWRLTFLGERKQGIFPGAEKAGGDSKEDQSRTPACSVQLASYPWAAQQRSLVIWGRRGEGP